MALDFDKIENEEAPFARRLADWVRHELAPSSALDLGCGPGTYVRALRETGVNAAGIDADSRVEGRPNLEHLNILDMAEGRTAKVVFCLEVAEHVEPDCEARFVQRVAEAVAQDGVLIWSAAQPGQGGEGHMNCQPPTHWARLLADTGLRRDEALEAELLAFCGKGYHMGWFVRNLLVFRRDAVAQDALPPVHLLALAHVPVTAESTRCAYTMKVYNLARMLKKLGYPVTLYGLEGSDEGIADEFVPCVSRRTWRKVYGEHDMVTYQFNWNQSDRCWHEFQRRAAFEMGRHFMSPDSDRPELVLCSFGWAHQPCTTKLPGSAIVVESGIGYRGSFADFRVFESQSLYNITLGREKPSEVVCGKAYWTVIPNYFDPTQFALAEKKNYFLYMGRLNDDKGYGIALDVAKRLGAKIVCVGQLPNPPGGDAAKATVKRIQDSGGLYVPSVGPKERKVLLAEARAVFVPTQYAEPFGGIHIEANASGTPVITTDWGVFPETVLQGVTGYRCKTMTEFVWAARHIHELDPKACRAWAVANFSMAAIAPRYDAYFTRLANLRRGRGWDYVPQDGEDPGELLAMRRHFPPGLSYAEVT